MWSCGFGEHADQKRRRSLGSLMTFVQNIRCGQLGMNSVNSDDPKTVWPFNPATAFWRVTDLRFD